MIGETLGCQRSVCSFHRPCAEEPSLATSQKYGAGNSVIIDTWCKAEMKLRSSIVWVLGLLLAIASVDTVPDPPAVNPRGVDVAYILGDVCGNAHERWLNSDSSVSLLLQVRWIAFTSAYEPNLPTDRIVLTGFATDPSPPSV
jgi:hypothetical protein